MKTYISMVYRLKGEGMSIDKAIACVASGYCLTKLETERLKSLVS
jgi:hypothetical protein